MIGESHTAAWSSDSGEVYIFGDNQDGLLGLGHQENTFGPQLIESLTEAASYGIRVKQVAIGSTHSICLMDMKEVEQSDTDGVFVWGLNQFSQLGLKEGNIQFVDVPTQLDPEVFSKGVKQVGAFSTYSAAIDSEGTIYTWGRGDCGRLGYPVKLKVQKTPCPIRSLSNVKIEKVALGAYHTIALSEDGDLYSWGAGINGQLGHGRVEQEVWTLKFNSCSNFQER